MSPVPPQRTVATFDSASALLRAVAAALRGEPFRHLGQSPARAAVVRVAGRLPWPVLREFYSRSGAAEALPAERLGDVDSGAVAGWLAGHHPRRRYPAVLVGSSNGAIAHLAAALGTPWLPTTVLVPVRHTGDPDRPADALRFGERVAPRLLDRNPDWVLFQMHDQVQDRLMVARMAYFRVKWRRLPGPYRRFAEDVLPPRAPVVLVEDTSTWPVTRVAERHVFQLGAQGGRDPDWYRRGRGVPAADEQAAEAEWGMAPDLVEDVERWCAATGRPLIRLRYRGPQAPSHAVAVALREWTQRRGEAADRLVVPSFVLADPWTTINAAAVPYWTFFPVQPALRAFEEHLAAVPPYRNIDVLLFNHGVRSAGIAEPGEWLAAAAASGARARLLAVRPDRFPGDIASLAAYGPALATLPKASRPWSPLPLDRALRALAGGTGTGLPEATGTHILEL
jgi:hypothetical protein